MQVFSRRAVVAGGLLALAGPACAQERFAAPSSLAPPPRAETATGRNGMVVTQEKRASRIGLEVLQNGGNAVDAAVAVGFALAVTLPRAGNLGGGGFMLVHLAGQQETAAIDYRETAPDAITPDVFLDPSGQADPAKSRDSALAVGVPGTVAGLAMALEHFGSGRFTLADLIAPAVPLARDGVPVEGDLLDSLLLAGPRLMRWPSAARLFAPNGRALGAGDRLVQGDLAVTLESIAREGPRAFYRGPIADEIVAAVRDAGGIVRRTDVQEYTPLHRTPVRGTYRGYDVVSMPPPSSGGAMLIEMLNILEGYAPREFATPSVGAYHLMVEAMKLAYADRAEYLGDADSVEVPIERLTSKTYAAELRSRIDKARAGTVRAAHPDIPASGGNTTHFSVVDRFGNAVANTTSLNFNYGLGLVAGSTGVLLNNTLDDFAAKPGAPNAFGLTGGSANAPGPRKRPLSSMTPTILLKDGRVALVTGAPGGSRIITAVLQVIVNTIDFKKSIGEAVAAPRVHDQWQPDEVLAEKTFPAEIVRGLTPRGHKVRVGPTAGSANSIAVTGDRMVGAADRRARDAGAAGY